MPSIRPNASHCFNFLQTRKKVLVMVYEKALVKNPLASRQSVCYDGIKLIFMQTLLPPVWRIAFMLHLKRLRSALPAEITKGGICRPHSAYAATKGFSAHGK